MPSSPTKLSRRNMRSKAQDVDDHKRNHPDRYPSDSSSDAESALSHAEYGLLDLDESMDCRFREGEQVWIKLKDSSEWIPGMVSGRGRATLTRIGEGMEYPVRYRKTKRDYFAPQNGVLKPDTQEVRDLLAAGGWLQ